MAVCINKIMTDEAVGGWKYNIHQCIYANCLRFIEICALKISEDWLSLLELFALVLNPCNKYVFSKITSNMSIPTMEEYYRNLC